MNSPSELLVRLATDTFDQSIEPIRPRNVTFTLAFSLNAYPLSVTELVGVTDEGVAVNVGKVCVLSEIIARGSVIVRFAFPYGLIGSVIVVLKNPVLLVMAVPIEVPLYANVTVELGSK